MTVTIDPYPFVARDGQISHQLTKENFLNNVSGIGELVDCLVLSSQRSSDVQKTLAESKSLRQLDNPERASDLYEYIKPQHTLEGRAAALITALLFQLGAQFDIDAFDISRASIK